MEKKNVKDLNIFVTDDDIANRAAAIKTLKDDLGYTDAEITEIAIGRVTEYDAKTFGGGGAKDAPEKASFLYIGKSSTGL
jgi:hypothetical protein